MIINKQENEILTNTLKGEKNEKDIIINYGIVNDYGGIG